MVSAVFASVNWLIRDRSRVLKKLVGDRKQLSESERNAKDELSARSFANLSEAEPEAKSELS